MGGGGGLNIFFQVVCRKVTTTYCGILHWTPTFFETSFSSSSDTNYRNDLFVLHSGTPAPNSWKGGLDLPYNIGIIRTGPDVTIQINAKLRKRNVTNIVGTILGVEEPDKWVLLGAHRDAWAFGAVDSSSGTAVIMEIARGLKELAKIGNLARK